MSHLLLVLAAFAALALLIPIPTYAQDLNLQLIEAKKNGQTEKMQALLDAGAEVSATDKNGETILIWAAAEGHTEIVELLKKAEAKK